MEAADIVVRGVPASVIVALDARAARLGLSRGEYVRRRLAQDATRDDSPVSAAHFAHFAEIFGDLSDPDVCWRSLEPILMAVNRRAVTGVAMTRPLAVLPLESTSLHSRWMVGTVGHLNVGSVFGSTSSTREAPVRVCSPARIGYSSETRVILVGGVR